jgi:hypothetical protein
MKEAIKNQKPSFWFFCFLNNNGSAVLGAQYIENKHKRVHKPMPMPLV